ncbi:g2897 [Coccomyxa elongata]
MSLWFVCLLAILCGSAAVDAQTFTAGGSVAERERLAAARSGAGAAGQSQSYGGGSFGGSSAGATRGTTNTFTTTLGTEQAGTAGTSRTSSANTLGGTLGTVSTGSGNANGQYNVGGGNGNTNGNGNVLGGNGNSNGNRNIGNQNGNANGNANTGTFIGNANGNQNTGSGNGNGNGNGNTGSTNGNLNGNNNAGSNNGNNNGVGNVGSGNGNGNGNSNCGTRGCGGGKSDPVMTGFSGRSFNFFGDVGKTYNLISSMNHQLSMKLKLAQMWNHNGTNMEGIGFMYKDYKVLMELDGDTPKVYINSKQLQEKKKVQKHAWRFEDGSDVEMSWNLYMPGVGNAVVMQTDVLKVLMWHTPKGIIDEGGKMLEGYLNFNISLLAPPENSQMNGIIGETYERFTVGQEAFNPNSTYWLPEDDTWHGKGPVEDYEMANYWDTKFKMNLFGLNSPSVRERQALETDSMPLPEQLSLRRKLLFSR